jgi:hypothetical protein
MLHPRNYAQIRIPSSDPVFYSIVFALKTLSSLMQNAPGSLILGACRELPATALHPVSSCES